MARVLTTQCIGCLHQEKTGLTGPDQAEEVARMVKAYVEGLCWVMAYYFDGVASWTWYLLLAAVDTMTPRAHKPTITAFCQL